MPRFLSCLALLGAVWASAIHAEEPKKAPEVSVTTATDNPKTVRLAELAKDGPVLVRLTCACSGCDAELPHFKKLAAAYKDKGLKTLAIFKEPESATRSYAKDQKLDFLVASDPDGKLWDVFETKTMPTNVLVGKGGNIIAVVKGCKRDGSNAEQLSEQIAGLLKTKPVPIASEKGDAGSR